MEPLLKIKNLSLYIEKRGKKTKILRNISYNLYPSQTLAVVGESGSGKTLSALSIMNLLPKNAQTEGEILYKGKNLLSFSQEKMRQLRGNKISMVFQEPMTSLNPVLTIGRQISETITTHKKISRKKAIEKSANLLKRVGLSDAERRLNDYPHNFSGGMRQRVMIAISMACLPEIIIADEPTTALDVTVQAQILNLFSKLRKENEMSLILITHNMAIVSQYADFVVVFYGGMIMEKGPCEKIFASPLHPYTKALLDSLPGIGRRKIKLTTIEGMPPNFEEETGGCPFYPRCKFAFEKCAKNLPPEFEVETDRRVRCWKFAAEKCRDVRKSFDNYL